MTHLQWAGLMLGIISLSISVGVLIYLLRVAIPRANQLARKAEHMRSDLERRRRMQLSGITEYRPYEQYVECKHCGRSSKDRPRDANGDPTDWWDTEYDCGCVDRTVN